MNIQVYCWCIAYTLQKRVKKMRNGWKDKKKELNREKNVKYLSSKGIIKEPIELSINSLFDANIIKI